MKVLEPGATGSWNTIEQQAAGGSRRELRITFDEWNMIGQVVSVSGLLAGYDLIFLRNEERKKGMIIKQQQQKKKKKGKDVEALI